MTSRPVARRRAIPLLLGLTLAISVLHPAESAGQSTSAVDLPVVEHVLGNGMRFLLLPRRGAPTVSFVLQYRVGSVNETLGSTGIAHLLEHLLFKGTTTIGTRNLQAERALFRRMDLLQDRVMQERSRGTEADTVRLAELSKRIAVLEDSAQAHVVTGEYDRIYTENGAHNFNATTTNEYTSYFVELPSNRARLWFVMEADRIMNPVFREFYAERDVVAEERRSRVETVPSGILYEAHMAAAFPTHPYGVPVIGHMSDIQRLTRQQAETYHRRFYAPNNAVATIVGDIEPDSVVAWAEEYFGQIPLGDEPAPILAVERPQGVERRVEVALEAQPQLRIGWRTVSVHHADAPPLAMLAYLLAGGRTSRLHRRLVLEDRLATFVSAGGTPGLLYPALFAIDASPRSPHTTLEMEEVIYQELDRLKEVPPGEEELLRLKNRMEAGEVRGLRSNLGLAMQLALSASLFNDWKALFRLDQRLLEVTPEDIQRVVRSYFTRSNRTVATLVTAPAENREDHR